jgi:hypothetical protein
MKVTSSFFIFHHYLSESIWQPKIMWMENAAQGHTTVEEEEQTVMKNLQLGSSGS